MPPRPAQTRQNRSDFDSRCVTARDLQGKKEKLNSLISYLSVGTLLFNIASSPTPFPPLTGAVATRGSVLEGDCASIAFTGEPDDLRHVVAFRSLDSTARFSFRGGDCNGVCRIGRRRGVSSSNSAS